MLPLTPLYILLLTSQGATWFTPKAVCCLCCCSCSLRGSFICCRNRRLTESYHQNWAVDDLMGAAFGQHWPAASVNLLGLLFQLFFLFFFFFILVTDISLVSRIAHTQCGPACIGQVFNLQHASRRQSFGRDHNCISSNSFLLPLQWLESFERSSNNANKNTKTHFEIRSMSSQYTNICVPPVWRNNLCIKSSSTKRSVINSLLPEVLIVNRLGNQQHI